MRGSFFSWCRRVKADIPPHSGAVWVEELKKGPPFASDEAAGMVEIGDAHIDLEALGYAHEVED